MDSVPVLEVYLDILFILNFIMDYFIFWMVSKITYQKVTSKRLCLGSLIAAVFYCILAVTPFLKTIHIGVYLIILPLVPIRIIFKPTNIRQFIQLFIISNITALVVGGMSFGVFYWVKEQNIISYIYEKTSKEFPFWTLLLSIVISYVMIQLGRYYMQKRNTEIQELYTLKIQYQDTKIEIEALLDTGNKVYDPITKHPVIIVEYKMLKSLLPENIQAAYGGGVEDIGFLVKESRECDFGTRIRVIPYHSLGNPNGILLGFKPDQVHISKDNVKWEAVQNIIIGIYQHQLHIEGMYHALLHADVVTSKGS